MNREEERLKNISLTYANDMVCDGAGSQLQRIYAIYGLTRKFCVSYYHSPLKEIGYQGMTALEKNENSAGLLHRYNTNFHIPSDIELPAHYKTITFPVNHGKVLSDLIQQAKEKADQFLLVRLAFVHEDPTLFQHVKKLSPFQKKPSTLFRVAIHFRVGELLLVDKNRILPNSYYLDVIEEVTKILNGLGISFVCELHTEFPTKSFVVTSEHHGIKSRIKEAMVVSPEQYDIKEFDAVPEVEKHFNEDPLKTLEAFATADLLIMSCSSFSYVPAVFNEKGAVIYFPFWHRPLPGWLQFQPSIIFKERFQEFCAEWKEHRSL